MKTTTDQSFTLDDILSGNIPEHLLKKTKRKAKEKAPTPTRAETIATAMGEGATPVAVKSTALRVLCQCGSHTTFITSAFDLFRYTSASGKTIEWVSKITSMDDAKKAEAKKNQHVVTENVISCANCSPYKNRVASVKPWVI